MSSNTSQPTRTEDEAACARLCVDFANHLDARRYAEVLDLFTPNGTLDRMGTVFTGRTAIESFLNGRPTGMVTRHLCTNIRVLFESADEATGQCYVLFFQGSAEPDGASLAKGPPSVVEYHDRFRRTASGWRIQERRIRMAIQG
ncbi:MULTISPECIES: nuclear transport factor 2 family protein [unclassified Variovorax]|uniref:nuclear transport factor 2 family protein n=1 Tax=unclassified Variovorax TaxID=663243 RepID=UPI001BD1FFBE|nr:MULTISPECIES: nuclear transport factor 2 family protein [unclassified Variovorax]